MATFDAADPRTHGRTRHAQIYDRPKSADHRSSKAVRIVLLLLALAVLIAIAVVALGLLAGDSRALAPVGPADALHASATIALAGKAVPPWASSLR